MVRKTSSCLVVLCSKVEEGYSSSSFWGSADGVGEDGAAGVKVEEGDCVGLTVRVAVEMEMEALTRL